MSEVKSLGKSGLAILWSRIKQLIPTNVSTLTNDANYQTADNVTATLANYAKTTDVPTVPSNVSAFTNDSKYQTASDVTATLNSYVTTSALNTALAEKADKTMIDTVTNKSCVLSVEDGLLVIREA